MRNRRSLCLRGIARLVAGALTVCGAAAAAEPPCGLDPAWIRAAIPESVAVAPISGSPPAASVLAADGVVLGYAFSSQAVVASKGFSGKPVDIAVALDIHGVVRDACLIEHHEPILIIGVADRDLEAFVGNFKGMDIRTPVRVVERAENEADAIDAVTGATVSSIVIADTVLRSARAIARSRGLLGSADLDFETFSAATWPQLIAEGSLVRHTITVGEAMARLGERGGKLYPAGVEPPPLEAPYLDFVFGLATPTRVGQNLLGDKLYNRLLAETAAGSQLLFVAGRGVGSFKGTEYARSGRFDRLQLVQGDHTFTFMRADYHRVDEVFAAETPEYRDLAVFRIEAARGFAPAEPWRLDILVPGEDQAGATIEVVFSAEYHLPDLYRRQTDADTPAALADRPLWQQAWWARPIEITILITALIVLSAILVFQDWLVRRPRIYEWSRTAFLAFTLLWLGWYAGAQLSVLNVLTFAESVRTEFRWDFFLLEPLLFILWSYVAVALLFWGRGVFCGWLCPFGALQELVNKIAQFARVPQIHVPFGLHERLWPVKYIAFLALVALSLSGMEAVQKAIEIEPFKTAIVLRFDREWLYVGYAIALILIGIPIQRAFCRYLCPLGAALAIPARLRMFEWLKRRWQCGSQCQRCAVQCPVQSIHPDGKINPNECVYCLNCQVQYYDDTVCPPLIERRKRREKIQANAAAARARTEGPTP